MSTVYQKLRSKVDAGCSPEEAAEQVIRSTPKTELAALVFPLLVVHARRFIRHGLRDIENEAHRLIDSGEDPLVVRRKLSQTEFALPDGRYVSWGQATAEDHRLRAQWQRAHSASCIEDAERHEAAAALIETAGVSCLDSLGEAAA